MVIQGNPKTPIFNVKINDDYNTPVEAWEFLFKNMPPQFERRLIWFPFYHDGSLIERLKGITESIIHVNENFFQYEPSSYDLIVDNPPFSCKKEILERCLSLGKPFALLLPLDTIERQYMGTMFKRSDKIKLLIPTNSQVKVGTSLSNLFGSPITFRL